MDRELVARLTKSPAVKLDCVVDFFAYSPEFHSLVQRYREERGVTVLHFISGSFIIRDATPAVLEALAREPYVASVVARYS